ncbi:MAG: hypothetical protein EXQ58_08985 [Acidobacteria bacterium]|nr:hypothetical protein [Acidobacteriota bacterium]
MSVLFANPIVSSFTALTFYVKLNVFGRVYFFVDLKPYLFTADMEFWHDVFKRDILAHELLYRACRSGMHSVSCPLAGLIVFERNDILI